MEPGALDTKFKVRAPLRCDGVGSLDCAEDTESGMRMAIRWLPVEANGEAAVKAVEELPRHPVLPRIRQTGRVGQAAYVAMDFPEGTLLGALLEEAKLTSEQAVGMGAAVADALALLHGEGMVHGELSADSVLVPRTGKAILWDVPLVMANRLTDRRGEERELAQLIRRAPYLSPERARGLPPSAAADVYALGTLLCLAVGAELPPARTTLAIVHQISSGEWKPELPRAFAPPLRALVARMVERDPLARPGAREVAATLGDLLHRTPTLPELPAVIVAAAQPSPASAAARPSPASAAAQPSPASAAAQPSPASTAAQPSPASAAAQPSPASVAAQPSPASAGVAPAAASTLGIAAPAVSASGAAGPAASRGAAAGELASPVVTGIAERAAPQAAALAPAEALGAPSAPVFPSANESSTVALALSASKQGATRGAAVSVTTEPEKSRALSLAPAARGWRTPWGGLRAGQQSKRLILAGVVAGGGALVLAGVLALVGGGTVPARTAAAAAPSAEPESPAHAEAVAPAGAEPGGADVSSMVVPLVEKKDVVRRVVLRAKPAAAVEPRASAVKPSQVQVQAPRPETTSTQPEAAAIDEHDFSFLPSNVPAPTEELKRPTF